MRTTFPGENGDFVLSDTNLTQKTPQNEPEPVKYPKLLKRRGVVLARIYRPCKGYPLYRLGWTVGGKRQLKGFPSYSAALTHGKELIKDLAKGSQAMLLTPGQAVDAMAALERLQTFYVATGRRVSLLGAVSQFCESAAKLNGHTLDQAVVSFLRTEAIVKRNGLTEAVDEFIAAEAEQARGANGRADYKLTVSGRDLQVSKYAYNRAIMLRRFAGTFPGTAVSELAKEHLDMFIRALAQAKSKSRNRRSISSAKSRNHHRAAIRQFLQWCVRKDYLSATHRLAEADSMRPELANNAEIQFYTPAELRKLLDASKDSMRAMIALSGLAGLRTAELLRLDWSDVWRVRGHIEVSAGKAKTRQRRLVQMVPALAAWLRQYRQFTNGKICSLHEVTWQQHFSDLCEKVKVPRKPNGLRHAFCTYHFARHGNENLTAQQAGNSPQMVHAHYKGLATKQEAEKWFAI